MPSAVGTLNSWGELPCPRAHSPTHNWAMWGIKTWPTYGMLGHFSSRTWLNWTDLNLDLWAPVFSQIPRKQTDIFLFRNFTGKCSKYHCLDGVKKVGLGRGCYWVLSLELRRVTSRGAQLRSRGMAAAEVAPHHPLRTAAPMDENNGFCFGRLNLWRGTLAFPMDFTVLFLIRS